MRPGAALAGALGGFYHQSWRFFLLNAALSAVVLPIVVAGLWAPLAWVLLPLAGPLAAVPPDLAGVRPVRDRVCRT